MSGFEGEKKIDRRDFLKGAAALSVSSALPDTAEAQATLSAKELESFLKRKPVILDTRMPGERVDAQGRGWRLKCPGCTVVELSYDRDMGISEEEVRALSKHKGKEILSVCVEGVRSAGAARFLSHLGFSVRTLEGGLRQLPDEFIER